MTCGETGPKVDPAIDVLAEEAVSNFGEVTDSIARGTPERRPLPADFFVSLSSLRSFPKFFPAWTCEVFLENGRYFVVSTHDPGIRRHDIASFENFLIASFFAQI